MISLFQEHCRLCLLSLIILFQGNTGDFKEIPVFITESDSNTAILHIKGTSTDHGVTYRMVSAVFFYFLFKRADFGDQTSDKHIPSFTLHPWPAQGISLLYGCKKLWKSIQRLKESFFESQKRDLRTVFMIFSLNRARCLIKVSAVGISKATAWTWAIHKIQWKREERAVPRPGLCLCWENRQMWWLPQCCR